MLKLLPNWQFFIPCYLKICLMIWMKNNRAPLSCPSKLCALFRSNLLVLKLELSSGIADIGPSILEIFSQCDIEIIQMTKKNMAPLLYPSKLCASFFCHIWIETGIVIQKYWHQSKIAEFLGRVTLFVLFVCCTTKMIKCSSLSCRKRAYVPHNPSLLPCAAKKVNILQMNGSAAKRAGPIKPLFIMCVAKKTQVPLRAFVLQWTISCKRSCDTNEKQTDYICHKKTFICCKAKICGRNQNHGSIQFERRLWTWTPLMSIILDARTQHILMLLSPDVQYLAYKLITINSLLYIRDGYQNHS